MKDTICALATAPGGALGVIRVSGPKALETVNRIADKDVNKFSPNSAHFRGWKMILPVSKTEWAPIIMQGESYKYNEVLQAKKTYNYLRLRLGLSTETKQLPLEHLEMSWYHFGSCTVYKKIDAGFHAARNWWAPLTPTISAVSKA